MSITEEVKTTTAAGAEVGQAGAGAATQASAGTEASVATMRAAVATAFGPAEVLLERGVPRPEPGYAEIRVAVHAAGVNPVDWKWRAGGGPGLVEGEAILGWDVSGVVEAVGVGASLYAVGDEVIGMPWFPAPAGAYAEYVVAPSRQFVPKPVGLTHLEAAALPLVGLTAWQTLVEVGRVGPGKRVLIHGAGGGLGHIAVQVAKARGAYVIGTASAGKHAWLRSLGADELVDYRETDFSEVLTDIDVVLETVGGDYADRSLRTMRDGGTLVSVLDPDPLTGSSAAEATARGIRFGMTCVEPDRLGLLALTELVAQGQLRPTIAATFPLAEAARAHTLGEQGATAGKIVLQVR